LLSLSLSLAGFMLTLLPAPPASGGTNPQKMGSTESESFAIFTEVRANQIQIQIPSLKKGFAVL
jgi:hypothetical protein